jgi:hypothetical protein
MIYHVFGQLGTEYAPNTVRVRSIPAHPCNASVGKNFSDQNCVRTRVNSLILRMVCYVFGQLGIE